MNNENSMGARFLGQKYPSGITGNRTIFYAFWIRANIDCKYRFYYIFMSLYNENTLKYAQILVTCGKFMIIHVEGHSIN